MRISETTVRLLADMGDDAAADLLCPVDGDEYEPGEPSLLCAWWDGLEPGTTTDTLLGVVAPLLDFGGREDFHAD